MVSLGATALAVLLRTVCFILVLATASARLILFLVPKPSSLYIGLLSHCLLWGLLQGFLGTSVLVLLLRVDAGRGRARPVRLGCETM